MLKHFGNVISQKSFIPYIIEVLLNKYCDLTLDTLNVQANLS